MTWLAGITDSPGNIPLLCRWSEELIRATGDWSHNENVLLDTSTAHC